MEHTADTKQIRSFGWTVGGVFVFIGLWPSLFRGQAPRLWALILAAMLIISALLTPQRLARVYRIWMAIGNALGWINTRIILGVIFYGLFTPIGLAMHQWGRDPMRRTFDSEAETYRVERQPRPGSHMRHQF